MSTAQLMLWIVAKKCQVFLSWQGDFFESSKNFTASMSLFIVIEVDVVIELASLCRE